ncbi:MAG TPA: guanylate kinase [Bacteroidota bacterium]|nr:guanylate kinase [Bacteroidota bacterium]
MPSARLIVISAPSGGGKTTIAGEILRRHPTLVFSVSATTRPKRDYEVNGVDYYFLSREDFQRLIDGRQLVEYEELFGQMYGTLRKEVDAGLNAGRSVLFDVDVKGALSIKKLYGETAVLIFVKPPDLQSLLTRLENRRTEDTAALKRRLERVPLEMAEADRFDFQVVNDRLEDAVNRVDDIVRDALQNFNSSSDHQKGTANAD